MTTSETAATESPKPEAAKPETAAAEAKPAVPEEKPFNTDIFESCTSRVSRRAWDIYLEYRPDQEKLKTCPLRGKLTANTSQAAQDIHKTLVEEGKVSEITTNDKVVEFTAPIAVVQLVIKNPNVTAYDAIKA